MGIKGGKSYDPLLFQSEVLRAEMVEVISRHCLEHAAKIADQVLSSFVVHRRSIKEKIA